MMAKTQAQLDANIKHYLGDGCKPHLHDVEMSQAQRLASARKSAGLTQQQVAGHFGISSQAVSQWESEDGTSPNRSRLIDLARLYRVRLEWLLSGKGDMRANGHAPAAEPEVEGESAPANVAWVRELDVRAAAGPNGSWVEIAHGQEDGSTVARYGFPTSGFRELFGAPPERVRIIEVVGDSNYPDLLPGQKVMVDVGDRSPSPPGFFVLWDGLGIVIKQVEYIPHSDPPRVRISSRNPNYQPYERTLDEAHILARVIDKWVRI